MARLVCGAILATSAALLLSACSSSGGVTTAPSGSSSGRSAVDAVAFSGAEANYKTLTEPTKKTGTKCSIGYQDVIASVPAQKAEENEAKDAAAKLGCSFMGLAAPVELLQYYAARTKYWAAKFGLHYLGEIDSQQDNPSAYAAATSAILGKYPSLDALFTFSDNSAVGAGTIARTSGRTNLLISGGDGSKEAIEAIKAGSMTNSPQPDFLASGRMLVWAGYDLITKQNLPLPSTLGVPVKLITKDNADSVTPIG